VWGREISILNTMEWMCHRSLRCYICIINIQRERKEERGRRREGRGEGGKGEGSEEREKGGRKGEEREDREKGGRRSERMRRHFEGDVNKPEEKDGIKR
jgi:hypothetical protein